MKVFVSTPTGNIGRALSARLLDGGHEVQAIARSLEKVRELTQRGARIVPGQLEDVDVLTDAMRGADVHFWLAPVVFSETPHAVRERMTAAGIAALKAVGASRVVHLSSVGAQHRAGNGLVDSLASAELALEQEFTDITHLRPAFFMENFLSYLPLIAGMGAMFSAVPADLGVPMVATRDIAEVAYRRVTDPGWRGRSTQAVLGPRDLSHAEVAVILTAELGRPVAYTQIPPDQAIEGMKGMGIPEGFAREYMKTLAGMVSGSMAPEERRDAANTTPTTFAAFARDTIKPLIARM